MKNTYHAIRGKKGKIEFKNRKRNLNRELSPCCHATVQRRRIPYMYVSKMCSRCRRIIG